MVTLCATTFNTKGLYVRLTERIYDLLGSSNRQQLHFRKLCDWFI